jgi:hypothetical protein
VKLLLCIGRYLSLWLRTSERFFYTASNEPH